VTIRLFVLGVSVCVLGCTSSLRPLTGQGSDETSSNGEIADDTQAGVSSGASSSTTSPRVGCTPQQREDAYGQCLDTCQSDADCAAATTCHSATGLCIPASESSATTQPCDPDSCADGFACPGSGVGECQVIENGCGSDADCDLTHRCEADECISRAGDVVHTCSGDSDCGLGMTCQVGVCLGCLDDIQCTLQDPDAVCVLGVCLTGTLAPVAKCLQADCPDGTRCNPMSGECEPTCVDDTECADAQICGPLLKRCMTDPSCEADSDCGDPSASLQTCTTSMGFDMGVCVGCSDTDLCKEGLRCVVGACLPDLEQSGPCANVSCSSGDTCDAFDGSCYPEDGTCSTSIDCRPGHQCNFLNLCSGCTIDSDCRSQQRCLLGTCIPMP
jgi:hypothetical protein